MLNISFTGRIFKEDGSQVILDECNYRGFFHRVVISSSSDTMDIVRPSELGYYNLNLGDESWLSQEGVTNPTDKVLILFWLPNSTDNLGGLTEWCFIEHTLDGSSTYVQDVQLKTHQLPTCSFSQVGNYVNTPVTITDTGTHDDYHYIAFNKDHYHEYQRYGQILFEMNHLPSDTLSIDWGDGSIENGLTIVDGFWNHNYSIAGDYHIIVRVENRLDRLPCEVFFDVHVVINVVNGLQWDEPVYINTPNQYNPDIGGDTSSITGVDYYIDGNLIYSNLAWDESFSYTFDVSTNHTIRQCIKYNDGIDDKIQCEDFLVTMASIASFIDEDHQCGKMFVSNSVAGFPPITNYKWFIMDGPLILAQVEGMTYDTFYYAWPYPGEYQVRLEITDSNGSSSNITKNFTIYTCPSIGGGSGGMGGSSITHTVYKDRPLPVIEIKKVEINDRKQSIVISDVKEIL